MVRIAEAEKSKFVKRVKDTEEKAKAQLDGAQKQVKNYYDQVVASQSASRKAVQEHAGHAQSLADKLKQIAKEKDDSEKKLVNEIGRLKVEITNLKEENAKLYDEKKKGAKLEESLLGPSQSRTQPVVAAAPPGAMAGSSTQVIMEPLSQYRRGRSPTPRGVPCGSGDNARPVPVTGGARSSKSENPGGPSDPNGNFGGNRRDKRSKKDKNSYIL